MPSALSTAGTLTETEEIHALARAVTEHYITFKMGRADESSYTNALIALKEATLKENPDFEYGPEESAAGADALLKRTFNKALNALIHKEAKASGQSGPFALAKHNVWDAGALVNAIRI